MWTKSKRKTNSMVILEICKVSVKIKGERIEGKKRKKIVGIKSKASHRTCHLVKY